MSIDGAFHKPAVASLIRMASLKRLELSPNCLEELETSRHAMARPTACPLSIWVIGEAPAEVKQMAHV